MKQDDLGLKWGTVKHYSLYSEAALVAMDEYQNIPDTFPNTLSNGEMIITGAAFQRDNEVQKLALCKVIDALNVDTVYLHWDGVDVSKEEAKKYVMEYGKK